MSDEKFEYSSFDNMVFPCCKKPLPAPLDGVAKVQCPCGNQYIPSVIEAFNQMVDIIKGWRGVTNGKAFVKAEPGQAHFIATLMGAGNDHLKFLDESFGDE